MAAKILEKQLDGETQKTCPVNDGSNYIYIYCEQLMQLFLQDEYDSWMTGGFRSHQGQHVLE